LLRKKSQTLAAFKHFDAMVRNQFKAAIGTLMSDFGGEYKSKDFDLFLKEKGIQSRTSILAYRTYTNKTVVQNASTEH